MASADGDGHRRVGIKLAPYNPTNPDAVALALALLALGDNEVLYDLGCGDGRFMVEAVKANATVRAVGVEYDVDLCERATANAQHSLDPGQLGRCVVINDNVLNVDLHDATAVFAYLVPEGMKALREVFVALLERGVRVVTYVFSVPGLTPQNVVVYKGSTKLYLYTKESLI